MSLGDARGRGPDADITRQDNGTERFLDFTDNRILVDLFGEHDQNLARIEQLLSVSIRSRGNRVAIRGEDEARERAERVLTDLYRRAKKGQEIGQGDVDGAVRLADPAEAAGAASGNLELRTRKRVIQARSPRQAEYIDALNNNELVFGLGPAGTGKTYLAAAVAVSMLIAGRVERIILSRPAVEAGERLGFLPGDMREKVDPYLRPLYDAIYDMLPGDQVAKRMEAGDIEVAPLAFMRGRTLANSFVILDEAQNTTPVQMKMFLTRLGENSRMSITGDPSQVDLPFGAKSGLIDALEILEGIDGIKMVRFSHADVVRHPLVTRVVKAYDERERSLLDQRRR